MSQDVEVKMGKFVELDEPIIRNGKEITTIGLRKPRSGELRGLSLTDVLQMDVSALTRLLPRISNPALTEQEVMNMDPCDLVQIGSEVASFLLPKKMKADYQVPEEEAIEASLNA